MTKQTSEPREHNRPNPALSADRANVKKQVRTNEASPT